MSLPVAVVDTTLLMRLRELGVVDLLPYIFSEVRIPAVVLDELGAKPGRVKRWIQNLMATQGRFYKRCTAEDEFKRSWWSAELHAGEAAVLAQTEELRATAVLDERAAVRIAKTASLEVLSSGAVLIRFKQQGEIAQVRPLLDRLRRLRFHLHDRDYEAILRDAGELDDGRK